MCGCCWWSVLRGEGFQVACHGVEADEDVVGYFRWRRWWVCCCIFCSFFVFVQVSFPFLAFGGLDVSSAMITYRLE